MAKGSNAFRTISEAAVEVGAPQHVLRFWETKFPFITPVKRAGGRRFYRPQDIVILKAVRWLLHEQGLTIKGVQKLHAEQGLARLAAHGDPNADLSLHAEPTEGVEADASAPAEDAGGVRDPARLRRIAEALDQARARLDAVLAG